MRRAWGLMAVAALIATTLSACEGGEEASPSPTENLTASPLPSAFPLSLGESWGDTTGLAAPGEVTIDPLLPDALPLPEGLLADTERGWVLVTYSPTVLDPTATEWNPITEVQVLFLISPEGDRYQVLELDSRRPMELLAWNAGDDHALVRDHPRVADDAREPADTWFTLDLSSGLMDPYTPSFPADAWPAGVTASGLRLWATSIWTEQEGLTNTLYISDLDGVLLNTVIPDGRLTFREDMTATGSVNPAGARLAWTVDRDLVITGLTDGVTTTVAMDVPSTKTCEFSGWLDETSVLVFCGEGDSWLYSEGLLDREAVFFAVDVSTGHATERGGPQSDSQFFEGFHVGNTLIGQLNHSTPSGAPGDDTGVYSFDGTTLTAIAELQSFAWFDNEYGVVAHYFSRDEILGDVLYGRFGGVSNDGGSATLIRWDSSIGEVTVLIPGHDQSGDPWVYLDILSVVIAQ